MRDGEPTYVEIDGRKIHVRVRGQGPLVVLEGGGGRAGVGYAEDVECQIATFATVITYDRAGLGGSDPPLAAPTAASMVADLSALLSALGVTDPAVFVGFSLSGLIVQLFACMHPELTRGLVLFDPTPMETFAGVPADLALPSFTVGANGEKTPMSDSLRLEIERLRESCDQVHRAVDLGLMPDVPLIVVTVGVRGKVSNAAHAGSLLYHRHKSIAERASRGKLIVAEKSEHTTLLVREPELAIAAIREVVQAT